MADARGSPSDQDRWHSNSVPGVLLTADILMLAIWARAIELIVANSGESSPERMHFLLVRRLARSSLVDHEARTEVVRRLTNAATLTKQVE